MSRSTPRRSVLLSFRFLGPSLAGSLVMALVSAFAPEAAQLAVLGAYVSILGGLFLGYLEQEDARDRERTAAIERLSVPLALAADPVLFAHYQGYCRTLTSLAAQPDPILREAAALKLAAVADDLAPLADGTLVFIGTEAWRTVYARLLESPDVREYRSVALVRTTAYWQDLPGRQSLRVNVEAAHRGVLVERVAVLADDLWPRGQVLPDAAVRPWLREQHDHGIHLMLVREADLTDERDLIADVGIYGDRAVGMQELDADAQTRRFTLTFDPAAVRLADDRWLRLRLYAVPYGTALEQAEGVI